MSRFPSNVRVGTAGWTDPTLLRKKTFYPKGCTTPEARLRHYASIFSIVEIDSTFYALPPGDRAEAWVERTPAGFVFDVKAHAFSTGHAAEARGLGRDLVAALPPHLREGRVKPADVPPEIVAEVVARFRHAMDPLVRAGKLGRVLLQFPPWITASAKNANAIARAAKDLALPCSVELRHGSWLAPAMRERTIAFFEKQALPLVCVDMPQGFASSLPAEAIVTSHEVAIVRFHGRNREAWEAEHETAATRFRYLYAKEELEAWIERLREMADDAAEVHVIMNNCFEDHAVTNARQMMDLLRARPSAPSDDGGINAS